MTLRSRSACAGQPSRLAVSRRSPLATRTALVMVMVRSLAWLGWHRPAGMARSSHGSRGCPSASTSWTGASVPGACGSGAPPPGHPSDTLADARPSREAPAAPRSGSRRIRRADIRRGSTHSASRSARRTPMVVRLLTEKMAVGGSGSASSPRVRRKPSLSRKVPSVTSAGSMANRARPYGPRSYPRSRSRAVWASCGPPTMAMRRWPSPTRCVTASWAAPSLSTIDAVRRYPLDASVERDDGRAHRHRPPERVAVLVGRRDDDAGRSFGDQHVQDGCLALGVLVGVGQHQRVAVPLCDVLGTSWRRP